MTNTPYSLITICILVLLSYLITYTFYKLGIFSKKTHRQIWNVLLLITFFITAIIGLLLVVKINYKIDLPYYDSLMKYHVEFGIAMAIISVFHFSWHIRYYLNLLKSDTNPVSEKIDVSSHHEINISKYSVRLIVFMFGLTSIITQIILLREFISVFNGNELVIGIILTNWMVLTSAGAYLGKYVKRIRNYTVFVCGLLLFLAVFSFVSAFLISYLKNIVFPVGVMISVYQVVYSSFIILIPVCLVIGISFTVLAQTYSHLDNQNSISKIYGIESLGSILGGIIFSLLLVFLLSQYQSLLALIIVNSLVIIFINSKSKTSVLLNIICILLFIISLAGIFFNIEKYALKKLYSNQEVMAVKNTPFGNIVITSQFGEYNVYNNNVLLFNTENIIDNEEAVHYAMCQHKSPKQVLLLSGGLGGKLKEILKYDINHIDYVEFNSRLMKIFKDSVSELTNSKIKIHISDPRIYLDKSNKLYDVILINLPEPSTIHYNRFYTREFFELIKHHLKNDGIVSFSMLSSLNYMNDEAVTLTSNIYYTLKSVFKEVIIIPGENNFFIASDSTLSYGITSEINNLGLINEYVNEYYIQDDLIEMRAGQILNNLNKPEQLNHDLKPLSYSQQINYWLGYFSKKYWIPVFIIITFLLIIFYKLSKYSKALFIAGFSASGLEIVIMFSLQVFFGNIYYLTGMIFAFFMTGLVIGAFYLKKIIKKINDKALYINHLIFLVFSGILIISVVVFNHYSINNAVIYIAFAFMTMFLGALTGAEFNLVSSLHKESYSKISGTIYSADLLGSAAGAFIITIYIIPWLGLIISAILTGIMNLLISLYLILYQKHTS